MGYSYMHRLSSADGST